MLERTPFFFQTQKATHSNQPHIKILTPNSSIVYQIAKGKIPSHPSTSLHFTSTTTTAIPKVIPSKTGLLLLPFNHSINHAALLDPRRLPVRVQKETPGRPARLRPAQHRGIRQDAGILVLLLPEAVSLFLFFLISLHLIFES